VAILGPNDRARPFLPVQPPVTNESPKPSHAALDVICVNDTPIAMSLTCDEKVCKKDDARPSEEEAMHSITSNFQVHP
jgi:hypothetical protein